MFLAKNLTLKIAYLVLSHQRFSRGSSKFEVIARHYLQGADDEKLHFDV